MNLSSQMVIMFGLHNRNQVRTDGTPMREYVPFRLQKLTAMQVKRLNKEKADADTVMMAKPSTERVDKVFMNCFEESDRDDSRLIRTRRRDGTLKKGFQPSDVPDNAVDSPSDAFSGIDNHDSLPLGPASRKGRTVFRRARQSVTESDTEIIDKPVSPKDISQRIIASGNLPVRNTVDSPRLRVPVSSKEVKTISKINFNNDNEETATDVNGNVDKYGFRTHSTYATS